MVSCFIVPFLSYRSGLGYDLSRFSINERFALSSIYQEG